jgi:hypothetical protein
MRHTYLVLICLVSFAVFVAVLTLICGWLAHVASALIAQDEPERARWEDGSPRVKVTLPKTLMFEDARKVRRGEK